MEIASKIGEKDIDLVRCRLGSQKSNTLKKFTNSRKLTICQLFSSMLLKAKALILAVSNCLSLCTSNQKTLKFLWTKEKLPSLRRAKDSRDPLSIFGPKMVSLLKDSLYC